MGFRTGIVASVDLLALSSSCARRCSATRSVRISRCAASTRRLLRLRDQGHALAGRTARDSMASTLSGLASGRNEQQGGARSCLRAIVAMLISSLLYVVYTAQTPLSVRPGAGYDDGLFMKLGAFLAQGEWLGPYNFVTLAKGPGYPAFLAVNAWLGLPVSVAHGLFQCTAVALLAWVVVKLSRSSALGLAVFLITLWHPVFPVARILRDAIYPGQVLLVLACASSALFVAERRGERALWGGATGLVLGWFWLTREEGVWLLPGLGVLLLFFALRGWRAREPLLTLLAPLASALLSFSIAQIAFQSGNWIAYGSFVGVDFKERNFQRAVGALQSVRAEHQIPYVAISRATRARIYEVSPAFATLEDHLDPPDRASPWQEGCKHYPWTCGEIAGGWIVWALRSASAEEGYYRSPADASAFFDAVASQVEAACRDARLDCDPLWISTMPSVTPEQLSIIPGTFPEDQRNTLQL